MFSQIGELIFNNEAVAKTSDFTMGLEVEMQRVDETGNVSQEPYPAAIGKDGTKKRGLFERMDQASQLFRGNAMRSTH